MGPRTRLAQRSSEAGSGAPSKARLSGKVAYLSDTDIFRDLNSRELEDLDRMTAMRTCRKGKVFYTPGETGEVLFIVKRGRVNLYRINPEGKKLVVATIDKGSVFGEMSIVGQGMYDTFAEAAVECTLCVMSRADVEHLVLSKPRVGLRFLELMAGRLRDIEARMENVAFKSVSSRVAASLLELSNDRGARIVGVSHQDLADLVGTYRETVTRILNEFQSEGYIELGRLNVTVLKPDSLHAVAEA